MGAIRLFLALVVVLDHIRVTVLKEAGVDVNVRWALGANAGLAVMYFYVISGFLIGYALNKKYGFTKSGSIAFYRGRYIRIFSLYWPVVIVVLICAGGARTQFLQSSWFDKITALGLFGIDWNISFHTYPRDHWSAAIAHVEQAWTLGCELLFYLLAPFLLRSRVAIFAILIGAAVFRVVAVQKFGVSVVWTYRFFPATLVFFMLGAAVESLAQQWPKLRHPVVAVALVSCPLLLSFPDYAGFDTARFCLATAVFALVLPSVFEATKNSRALNALGDLSYPVYLVHLFVIWLLGKSIFIATAPGLSVHFIIAITILAALLAHHILEKPFALLMEILLRGRRETTAVARAGRGARA